ncbi:imelysin family protein [Reinekea sp.]|jgi:putative iron-regulated protein|uniref:imelysin family protein n=1 Tax=Reinekea sp. TaxID=1970455 RepID=UPI00398A0A72
MKKLLITPLLICGLAQADITTPQVVNGYADLALTTYTDAHATALALHSQLEALVKDPSQQTLNNAKTAWIAARPSYQQSEVFRFGNSIVDDWEGQLNAWPLDEGLIDYVNSDSYEHELGNEGSTANIIANKKVGDLKVSRLSAKTLANLNEFGGSEANVATGYHAIEFLLWGQDLNGHEAGAGNRPWTDYAKGDQCSDGNCKRRGKYLLAASDLLIDDLEYMVGQWTPGEDNYRAELVALESKEALNKMLFGMGSLSLGELAGERIKVALTANSTEDEHDCFSDNTHNSHYYNAQGIANVFYGRYESANGQSLSVPSLRDYFASQGNYQLVSDADAAFGKTQMSLTQVVKSAEQGVAFDQLIAPGNSQGKALLTTVIGDLVNQTQVIENMAQALELSQLSPDDAGHEF